MSVKGGADIWVLEILPVLFGLYFVGLENGASLRRRILFLREAEPELL